MKILNTKIKDCLIIENHINDDQRGYFVELFKSSYKVFNVKQSNLSFSKAGVLRGIHRTPYAKLVTCISGSIYDVCIDLRINSTTYRDHIGIYLNANNLYSLLIPPYCGHGFIAMENSLVIYHQTDEYNVQFDETYCYKDFNISWPIEPALLSMKDTNICYGK